MSIYAYKFMYVYIYTHRYIYIYVGHKPNFIFFEFSHFQFSFQKSINCALFGQDFDAKYFHSNKKILIFSRPDNVQFSPTPLKITGIQLSNTAVQSC